MSYNGAGTFVRLYNWTNDKNNSINITASRMDGDSNDFVNSGFNTAFCRDGQAVATGNFNLGAFRITALGAATALTDAIQATQIQKQSVTWCGNAGGTADALTLTPSPASGANAVGQRFQFKATATNATTTPTAAISGLTAITIQKNAGTLLAGDITTGKWYELFLDTTSTAQLNPLGAGPAASVGLTSAHLFVGNASNVATDVALSGDATLANTGALTIAANAVTNAKAAQMTALTLKGNATTSTANATDLAGSSLTPFGISTNQNIIHNGDVFFDQPNEGASVTVTTGGGNFRSADRWYSAFTVSTSGAGNPTIQRQTASSGAPANLAKSLLITASSSAGSSSPAALRFKGAFQNIEGSDVADLAFGTAGAATITVSAWLKSSIAAATYCIWLKNQAANRSYVHNCSVPSANTWTFISFTLVGDITGTWLNTANATGLTIGVQAAAGSTFQTTADTWSAGNFESTSSQTQLTNTGSATLEITGLKLERGSTATPSWSMQTADNYNRLKRYYWKTFEPGTAPAQNVGSVAGALTVKNPIALGDPSVYVPFNPPMFAGSAVTVTTYNPSAANANWRDITAGSDVTVSVDPASTKGCAGVLIGTSGTVTTLGDILGIHATFDGGI